MAPLASGCSLQSIPPPSHGILQLPTDSTDGPHVATPTGPDTPTPLLADDDPKPKVDQKAEVSRLLKQLRSGKQDVLPKSSFPAPSTPPKKVEKKAWKKSLFSQSGFGNSWTPELPGEDPLVAVCREVIEEMDVGNRLLKFCCDLPVLLQLSRSGDVFATSSADGTGGADEGDAGTAALINRCVHLRPFSSALSPSSPTSNLPSLPSVFSFALFLSVCLSPSIYLLPSFPLLRLGLVMVLPVPPLIVKPHTAAVRQSGQDGPIYCHVHFNGLAKCLPTHIICHTKLLVHQLLLKHKG